MTDEYLKKMEDELLKMNPEERKKFMDSIGYKAKGITGFPSQDEPWMKNYQKNAREIASNIVRDRCVSDIILDKLDDYSDVDAIRYLNASISRADFKVMVEKWAKAFRQIGVEADEIVPIYGTFFPDVCAMILALNQIGAVVYPLKLNSTKEDFETETSESKVAIVYDGMWGNVSDIFSDDRFKYVISVSAADGVYAPLKQVVQFKNYLDSVKKNSKMPSSKKFLHSKDMMELADSYTGEYKEPFKKDRVAFINTSSGSTINGKVKGIMSTNEAACAQLAKSDAAQIPYFKGDSVLTSLPPTASTALFCLFLFPLYKGVTIIDEPRLNENKFYSQVLSYKPQIAFMTGSFWKKFFRELQDKAQKNGIPDLSFLKVPLVGGEPVTPREMQSMNEILKFCGSDAVMIDGYGMSEFFSVFSTVKKDVKPKEDKTKQVICAGLPFPNVKAGIFDENGNELGYNERGELYMTDDDVVMHSYFKKPELTQSVLKDGWLHSGDIAEMDEEGLIYVYGRKTDKTTLPNGEEVYLFDIANKIKENQNVEDVMIFSIPLADGSNALLAHIIFENNFYGDKDKELELIDKYLEVAFDGKVYIDGYKEHERAFTISSTIAKADRNSMYNDRSNYIKVVDGDRQVIDLVDVDGKTVKLVNEKNDKNNKVYKKQM